MEKQEFLDECKEWNICPSDGWAEIVTDAYFSRLLWNENADPFNFRREYDCEGVRLKLCDNFFSGPFAWVDRKGRLIPVSMGGHDPIAMLFLGETVSVVERKCARISHHSKSFQDTFKYVDSNFVTDAMIDTVATHMMENRGGYWGFTKYLNP